MATAKETTKPETEEAPVKEAPVEETAKKDAPAKDVKEAKSVTPKGKYYYAVGRRKTSVARVRLYMKGSGGIEVNSKMLKDYAQTQIIAEIIKKPLIQAGLLETSDVTIRTSGGGFKATAEAISLGISRALLLHDANLRASLKPLGLLKRDPRKKERKKPGLKRARRAPQWAKR